MMLVSLMVNEVEVKISVADHQPLKSILEDLGAEALLTEALIDTYYDTFDLEHLRRGESIRVREESNGKYYFTAKGQRYDQFVRAETNEEVGENIHTILTTLGVSQRCIVSKIREAYQIDNILVCFDDVVDLGTFVEFEILTDGGESEAMVSIVELMKKLGLDVGDAETKSYYELRMKQLGI